MRFIKRIIFITALSILLFTSCNDDDDDNVININAPEVTHYTVKFGEGENWVLGLPIFQQELTNHIAYQTNLFVDDTMKMAGFLLETNEARYFQKVTSETEINQILSEDPAMIDKTFSVKEKEPISIIIEQVLTKEEIEGKTYFLVEYLPGTAWNNSKKLWEQDLTEHQNYIGGKFGEKFVLRGIQYLTIDKAMYIVLAANISEAQAFTNNDPAVNSNVFTTGIIIPYTVNAEQL